jgi:hypothetical protein
MPESAATATPAPPPTPEVATGRVHVVNRYGTLGSIPASDLERAAAEGYRLATPEQVAAAREADEYRGTGHAIGAAAAGAARGLTLGLSDIALAELGAKETIAAWRRTHPSAGMAGELAGTVAGLAGAAVAKGAAGAAGVLRAAAAPTRAALGIGEAAEAGAAALGLGKAATTVARGTAEAAAYGLGQGISSAALGDADWTAEHLLSSAAQGALFGGGAALGMTAAGAGIRAVGRGARGILTRAMRGGTPADIEALAAREFGEAAPGLGQRVADWVSEQQARLTGAEPAALRRLNAPGVAGREAREIAVYRADDVLDAAHRDLSRDLTEAMRASSVLREAASGAPKESAIRSLIGEADANASRAVVAQELEDLLAVINQIATKPAPDAAPSAFALLSGKARGRLKELGQRVRLSAERLVEDDAAAHFIAADQAKRVLGAARTYFEPTMLRNAGKAEIRAVADALGERYERLQRMLESPKLWGRAGEAQAAINAPWSTSIRNKEFAEYFGKRVETEAWGKKTLEADDAKVGAYIRGLLSPTKDRHHAALRGWLDAMGKTAKAAQEHYALVGGRGDAAATLQAALGRVEKTLAQTTDATTLANQYRAIVRAETEGAAGVLGAGALVGGVVGGAPGAVVGALGSVLARPGTLIRQRAAIEALARRSAASVEGRASRWLAGAAEAPSRWAARAAAQVPPIEERYERQRKRIADAQAQPAAALAVVEDATREVTEAAPAVGLAVQRQAAHAASYLARTMPVGIADRRGREQPPPSEAARWLRRLDAIRDPRSVATALRDGSLGPEQVEAFAAAYPRRYAALQTQLLGELDDLADRGREPDFASRLRLSMLLGAPIEPTAAPEMIAAWQSTYAPAPEPPRPARPERGAPDLARHFRDESDRLESER